MSKNNGKTLVICGCHEGGVLAIKALINEGYKFDAFVCLTPEQAEKYQVSGYFDYRGLAEQHDIPVYLPKAYDLKTPEDQAFFESRKFDLLVQGGWQRLFPAPVLATLSVGAIGLHGSADYLPKGRGRSPMNWSLIEGRKRFLMHLFMIKPGIDDGDVADVMDFDITEYDDIVTLYYKYAISYKRLLLENLPHLLLNQSKTVPQVGKASYYEKRSPADGLIDWEEMDVWEIYNSVRAQTKPYPGAFADIDGKLATIWKARPFDTRLDYPDQAYGSVVERFGEHLVIRCRGGLLLLEEWEDRKQ